MRWGRGMAMSYPNELSSRVERLRLRGQVEGHAAASSRKDDRDRQQQSLDKSSLAFARRRIARDGKELIYRLAAGTLAASGTALGMVVTRAPVPCGAPAAAVCAC